MQDELINAMSDKDIEEMKGKYADNASVILLLDGILATRGKDKAQAKAKQKFEAGIAKLFSSLPHPEDVHNVYVRWAEVEEEVVDEEAEEVEVEVVKTPAVLDKDGKIVEEAVVELVKRKPTVAVKVWKWVVQVNKSVTVKPGASGKATTSKRAIKVFKRNGTQLEDKGNYQSASKACEKLGLTIGGDSATRVLARDGFITEPYEGTDYTS